MTPEEKYELITRNLAEVVGDDELKILLVEKEQPSVYWGTMPTGSVSIAYFFPMMKVADFLAAGIKVKLLMADLHGALDSVPWDMLEKRTAYYKAATKTILETLGVDSNNLEFIQGKDLQLNEKYFYDLLKLSTFTSEHAAKKASSEVVKQSDNPKLSGLIYPLMQALDEEYLDVDMQLGGMDQRKIMVFAREVLPKLGYRPRIELLNPLIRGLVGEKMSSSQKDTKIDLMDDEKTLKKRINGADCVAKDTNNGILPLVKYLIFGTQNSFLIERPEKYGGNLEYDSYEAVEKDFVEGKLHPLDLKNGVSEGLNTLLSKFRNNEELLRLHKEAYPEEYQ